MPVRDRAKWTPSMTNSLLNHLEAHKGDNGLYCIDRKTAFKDIADSLTKSFSPLTPEQISTKFVHLFDREGVAGYTRESLFSKGRCVLREPYNESLTLDPRGQTDARDYKETSADELGEEFPAGFPRGSDTELERTRTPRRSQHSRDLPSSLDPVERQPSLDQLSSSASDESEYVPALPTQTMAPRAQTAAPRANSLVVRLPLETHGLRTATEPAPDDILPLSQVNRPAAEPSAHIFTPSRTVMSSYRGGTTRKIQDYLADDKDHYIPSQRNVTDQKSLILSQINSAVESLLESRSATSATQTYANMDYERIPRIYEALSDDDFCGLCIRIYGVGTTEELKERIGRSYLYIKDFLRGLLAAAVADWVFDERHVSLQRDIFPKTNVSQAYEKEVWQVSEELHEQLLRKSRSLYINDEDNFKTLASDLSMRLCETMKRFLYYNHLRTTGDDSGVWLKNLKRVFLGSLKLKAQTALRRGKHTFRSPGTDDVFDGKVMTTVEGVDTQGNRTVQIALFPALVQIIEPQATMDDAKEVIIFPATVVLQ